jgi:hypothetical protein
VAILAAMLALAGCSTTITQSPATTHRSTGPVKIDADNVGVVLMPIDIEVTKRTAAGLEEPKADWTVAARKNVMAALDMAMAEHGLKLRHYQRPGTAERARRDDQLEKLHATVSGTILAHHFSQMDWLPTKGGRLDWTLGRTARYMGADQNSQFALFVRLRGNYADSGPGAAAVTSAMVSGPTATPAAMANPRIGFASLVDLRSGSVLWFNIVSGTPGDMREAETARRVVEKLMSGFPI